jgi:hypothetical protein
MVEVHEKFALHESGTKFYKVYLVKNDEGRCAVVSHYGKYSEGMTLTPMSSGQSELLLSGAHGSDARSIFDKKVKEKAKRGYRFEPDFKKVIQVDAAAGDTQLSTIFKSDMVKAMLGRDGEAFDDSTASIPSQPERQIAVATVHEELGSW